MNCIVLLFILKQKQRQVFEKNFIYENNGKEVQKEGKKIVNETKNEKRRSVAAVEVVPRVWERGRESKKVCRSTAELPGKSLQVAMMVRAECEKVTLSWFVVDDDVLDVVLWKRLKAWSGEVDQRNKEKMNLKVKKNGTSKRECSKTVKLPDGAVHFGRQNMQKFSEKS